MKPKAQKKILIAGIGNVFHADDGFGVEVATRLKKRGLPESVSVIDFGIRGLDFAYALLDGGYDIAFMVDTVSRGGPPGTLYVLQPLFSREKKDDSLPSDQGIHGISPSHILKWVNAMGVDLTRLRLIGCEPADLGSEECVKMELSAPVREAVGKAVDLIERLIENELVQCGA